MNRFTPAILEVKLASVDTTGHFTGYASTFGGPPDSYGDIISKGAFLDSIKQHKSADTMPAMLWAHNHEEPIGKWLSLVEDSHGLLATGKLTLGTKRGAEAYELLKDGAISFSIGFTIAKDGTKQVGNIRNITKIGRLGEISLVSIPANSKAKLVSLKSKPQSRKEYERLLRNAGGYSANEAKRASYGGYSALARKEQDSEKLDDVLSVIEDFTETILSTMEK